MLHFGTGITDPVDHDRDQCMCLIKVMWSSKLQNCTTNLNFRFSYDSIVTEFTSDFFMQTFFFVFFLMHSNELHFTSSELTCHFCIQTMMVCVALKSKQKQFNGQRYTTNTNFWDFLRNSIWWINNFGENLSRFCKLLNTCFSHSRNLAGTKFCGLGLNPQKSQNLVPAIFSPLRVD